MVVGEPVIVTRPAQGVGCVVFDLAEPPVEQGPQTLPHGGRGEQEPVLILVAQPRDPFQGGVETGQVADL
jgi:hypothetical protein